jgi:hypothetical protein
MGAGIEIVNEGEGEKISSRRSPFKNVNSPPCLNRLPESPLHTLTRPYLIIKTLQGEEPDLLEDSVVNAGDVGVRFTQKYPNPIIWPRALLAGQKGLPTVHSR